MQNITIGRYKPTDPSLLRTLGTSKIIHDVADYFSGWIEGTREDGSAWILWLDENGSPSQFWAQRDDDGAVIGDPITL